MPSGALELLDHAGQRFFRRRSLRDEERPREAQDDERRREQERRARHGPAGVDRAAQHCVKTSGPAIPVIPRALAIAPCSRPCSSGPIRRAG